MMIPTRACGDILASDAYAIYMSIDDSLRRLCNQAFFEQIWITDTIQAQPNS